MSATTDRLRRLLGGFATKTILVIGDVIIDEYLFGKPARISREAPVLILRFNEREVRLGGAANAAHNVRALGARVLPIGVVGKDASGDELLGLFHAAGMPTDGLATEAGRVTPMKTRIMAGGYQATRQQVVRLDREPASEPQPMSEDAMLARLSALGERADGFLVSDYGYGTVTPRVFERVRALARRTNATVTVDSRYQLVKFAGVPVSCASSATVSPAELRQALGATVS
jgi:rfaE bifunctional protein kinase chain/domain